MSRRCVASLTVEEMLVALEELEEVAEDVETINAVIIPPEADTLTDNQDIDDDCTGNVDVEDVFDYTNIHATSIGAEKWYWPICIRILDMAVMNAHVIYNLLCSDDENSATEMDLLSFRRAIWRSYLKIPTNRQQTGKKRSCQAPPQVSRDVHFDCKGHIIMKRIEQRRCQNKPCTASPWSYCSKCEVTRRYLLS